MSGAQQGIIVTGASRGLGAHIAEQAAATGYTVIGLSRSGSAPTNVRGIACDVSDEKQLAAAAAQITEADQPYALINAAGIAAMNLLVTTPPATIRNLVNTNLLGTMLSCATFSRLLMRRKAGRIINFSTIAVALALKGESVYAGTKAGVEGFSRAFAREMADFGVTVNCIAPGPIATDLIRGVPAASINNIVAQQIIPKQAQPQDVWQLTRLLLQPESAMLTGTTLHLGGA